MKRTRCKRRLMRAVRAAAVLPLGFGSLVACSDRSKPAAASPDAAAQVLAAIPDDAGIEDKFLREDLDALRAARTKQELRDAIETLRAGTDSRSIPFLAPLIRYPDPEVAESAVGAIEFVAIATQDGIPVLSEAVQWDVPPPVRKRILEALYHQRTEVENETIIAKPMLIVLERDPDPLVRFDAAEYIGALNAVEVIPQLRERMDAEKDARVRKALDWAIRYLGNEAGPNDAPKIDG